MYGPQGGHNPRLNGVAGGRSGQPPLILNHLNINFVPGHHHHGQAQQQHPSLQQDHSGGHATPGSSLNHAASGYSSGILSNVTPFTPQNQQNGHHTPGSRAGHCQQLNEHMTAQLEAYRESETAHHVMTEQHQPHYFARIKASENKGIGPVPNPEVDVGNANGDGSDDGDEGRVRPVNIEKSQARQDWKNLDLSGQGLRAISTTLFSRYTFLTELYLSSNNLTYLPSAIGQLRALTLLDVSYNQLSDLPPELGMCVFLKKLLFFNNHIQDLPHELGSLYKLEVLGWQGNAHLRSDLKQKLNEQGTKALMSHLKDSAPRPNPPQARELVSLQDEVPEEMERIRVMTWNTLCDKLASPDQYGYTPTTALSWEHRKEEILKGFLQGDPDVLCVQEMAGDAFNDYFSVELAKHDYRGFFDAKTNVRHANNSYDKGRVDGCAIFYKNTKFICLHKESIVFSSVAISRPDFRKANDVYNRIMNKHNIGMFCLFESRATGARFIVAHAHLVWRPDEADVKAVQAGILLEEVTKTSEKWTRKAAMSMQEKILIRSPADEELTTLPMDDPNVAPSQDYRSNTDIPLIVCGDYNSTKDSLVYEFLQKGRGPPDHADWGSFKYGDFTTDGIAHPFNLRSVYSLVENSPQALTFTNYVKDFIDVIDYIFYSANTLMPVSLLGPPDQEYLKRVPGFPHWHFPSDHIQLMAEFAIKRPRKEQKRAG